MTRNRIKIILLEISAKHNDPKLVKELTDKIEKELKLHRVSINRILRNAKGQPLAIDHARKILPLLSEYGNYTLDDLFEPVTIKT